MPRNQQHLKLRLQRLRDDVAFTAENDHNPLVLDDCPRCNGYGKYDVSTDPDPDTGIARQIDLHLCEVCGGGGRASVQVPYFDNDAEPVTVRLPANGLLRCPRCGWGLQRLRPRGLDRVASRPLRPTDSARRKRRMTHRWSRLEKTRK